MTLTACRHFGQTRHRHREHVSRSYRFGGALYPLRRAGGPELSEGCVTIRPVDWSKVNTPAAPRPDPPAPTLIRTVWVMTRPPNKRVTAGIYQTRFGHELRVSVGRDQDNVIDSLLSRTDDAPLESRAVELGLVLEQTGWATA
jgi:hypothetical protein